MPYYVITDAGTSWSTRAASKGTLTAALRAASLVRDTDGSPVGAWIGPAPRVVRRGSYTSALALTSDSYQTFVAWLYQIPDTFSAADQRHAVEALIGTVNRRLSEGTARSWYQSGSDMTWSGAMATPHSAIVHGPVSWWASGEASITRTGDEFPVGSTDAAENPIGPSGPTTHPSRVTDDLGMPGPGGQSSGLAAVITALPWVVLPTLGALVLFIYVPPRVMPWNWSVWDQKNENDRITPR